MNVYVQVSDPVYIRPGAINTIRVYCNEGDAAVGSGHFNWSGAISYLESSRPIGSTNPVGWSTSFYNDSLDEKSFMAAMVTCLDMTP
jgi:hypothetical protein